MRGPLLIVGILCATASCADTKTLEIARQLSNEGTRRNAVAQLVASGNDTVSLLLSLAKKPPAQLDEHALFVGLADAFGQLKTKEAIPFLIENISLERGVITTPNILLKTTEVIQQRMPAVAALIQIGPEASRAVMDAWTKIDSEDRIWAIIVVSQIRGVSEARAFLSSVVGEANQERLRAEEGLKAINGEP